MLETAILLAIHALVGLSRTAPSAARSLIDAAVDARHWDQPGVRERLDLSSIDELRDMIGEPQIRTSYAIAAGTPWQPGAGRPALADDDPAVQQVIAYCAASRARRRMTPAIRGVLPFAGGSIHPTECGFCQYPDAEVWAAVGWAVMVSRYITDEIALWPGAAGHSDYVRRTDRIGTYESPRHKTFWGIPKDDRNFLLDQAAKAAAPAVSA